MTEGNVIQDNWFDTAMSDTKVRKPRRKRFRKPEREMLCSNLRCGQIGEKMDKRRKRKVIAVPSDYPKRNPAYCSAACAREDAKTKRGQDA